MPIRILISAFKKHTSKKKTNNEHVRRSVKVAQVSNDKEDHREKARVVRRRARSKKNVRCTSTRKEIERKTENQVERPV